MREILFRAKRKDNGEWIYGYPLIDTADCSLKAEGKCVCPHDGSYAKIFYWSDNFHEYEDEEIIPETRGEYTGLTDKNGVKIFEGDILRFINTDTGGEWLCTVEFHEGAFIGRNTKDKSCYCHFDFWNTSIVQWEVIGNIHDNLVLLEDG